MSFLLMAEAIKKEIKDPMAKWLLVILADYCNEQTGECFPSLQTLATRSEMHVATVSRKLSYLESKGFIKRIQRLSTSTMYKIVFAESDTPIAESDTPYRTQRHKPITKHKTYISNDYFPSKDLQTKLLKKYERIDIKNETDKFIDYHRSKGNKFVDVDSAFRNWIRKAVEFRTENESNRSTKKNTFASIDKQKSAFFSEIMSHVSTED